MMSDSTADPWAKRRNILTPALAAGAGPERFGGGAPGRASVVRVETDSSARDSSSTANSPPGAGTAKRRRRVGPGLGRNLDEAAINRYRVEGFETRRDGGGAAPVAPPRSS